jgi:hypothetical protein
MPLTDCKSESSFSWVALSTIMLSASCSLNQLIKLVVVDKGGWVMWTTVFSPEKSWV